MSVYVCESVTEVCWASLLQPKSLMKMGLCMVLVGHVTFLLGALVHGIVLRHISIGAQTPEYAISNILALTAGLVGVLVGILAIVLSKNEKSQPLTWCLCVLSTVGVLLAAASAIGLLVSLVWAIVHGRKGLLLHCNLPDDMSYFSITDECPFDPTRIYSTTLILWVLLIIMSVVEVLFSGRCLAVCINFIRRKPAPQYEGRSVKTLRAAEPLVLPAYTPPPRYRGDGEERLPERPPEQHELLRTSQRLYSSTHSAQNRPSTACFDRARLNRASFWI
ncbi:transmembrane protein 54b isoform X1 [Pygocentrus nattereri]|uniref:transmembrane protein 54b isoform X1 n=2 Tax=Pygocentrus nattereri TaxID=42514 RepID=UPI0008148FDF|nr:transmembrane protein 54b isoform X1 [Pygocentrus nattereri]